VAARDVGEKPRRMRVDAWRNRERLLVAARDVFVEHGVDAALEDVARRAGVGIATLYRRFRDREELIRAVALDVLVRVAAEARAAHDEEPDAFAALARLLHRALDLRIAAVMPVLDGGLDLDGHADVRAARDELSALFEVVVRAAYERGGLRRDMGTGDIALMVIRLARPLPGAFAREFDTATAHRQLDLMLHGLRADPGGTAGAAPMSLDELRSLRRRGR
jgi:AcrR family transcriptional regulator